MELFSQRPWGSFLILYNGPDCKVKQLIVNPSQRLSLQSHQHRNEHWFIVSGSGCLIQLNDNERLYQPGDSVNVQQGDRHRITNTGDNDIIIIEIQTGSYFGEDDIIRYEDIYGRILS